MGQGGVSGITNPDFLSVSAFEDMFWLEAERIRTLDPKSGELGRYFVGQHPSRTANGPGPKHTNEWLPLLILAKHEAGRRRNWDAALHLAVSHDEDRVTETGESFDAIYRFEDRNLRWGNRSGHIEITRALSGEASLALKEDDLKLSTGEQVIHEARDIDAGLLPMKEDILRAVEGKAAKFRKGRYPIDTTLLVWIRQDQNPGWSRSAFETANFKTQVQERAGTAFVAVCVVGINCGVIWAKGVGL